LLQKPMLMIEKQIEQQKYMFEEAHKQKDFLERMFGELLQEQRHEMLKLFDHQSRMLDDFVKMNESMNIEIKHRLQSFESVLITKLALFDRHMDTQIQQQIEPQQKTTLNPQTTTPKT